MDKFIFNIDDPVHVMRNNVENMLFEIQTKNRKNMLRLLNKLFDKVKMNYL